MDDLLWRRVDKLREWLVPTEVVALSDPRLHLFAKMESANPSGSAKDRSAYWILREAVRRGDITRGTTVVESSSGNFALSLARFCRVLGVRFVPVIDPNVNGSTERVLRHECARVEKVVTADETGGFLQSRLRRVAELRAELPGAYWPDQYSNVDGARGHYELTGGELVGTLEHLDYLFVGVGSGATVAGLSRRVAESCPGVTVVAVDVEGSAIFGQPPHRRRIPGIGSSIRPPLLDQARIDDVMIMSEQDEVDGCHELWRTHDLFAGGSTGCVYRAINRYFESLKGPPPVVAFLCADRGEPYRDTVYDPAWVARELAPLPGRR